MSDPRRITDWGEADLQIKRPQPGAQLPVTRSIKYEPDRVIAYLDARMKPTTPEKAVYARIWTKDGVKLMTREPAA